MENTIENTDQPKQKRRFDRLHVTLIVLVTILITMGVAYWIFTAYIFPSEFKPVTLSAKEEQVLTAKLERFESLQTGIPAGSKRPASGNVPLKPEKYSEEGAKREIVLSEKELNSLLAKNTDLAKKLAIDLSDDLVSAKLLVHVDEDFPFMGGKILKVRAGAELAYREGKPIVVLKGVSIMGVPIPNAWLGGLKNIDLVREFGNERGFWKSFSEGVENIHVEDGQLMVKLKE